MAKVIGPLNSSEARGRVDALVYGTWRGIRYVRSYVAPEFAVPDPRTAQKARVAAANVAWKLLSDDQRQGWHNYAQDHPRLDWSGVTIRITGYNAFVSCYTICTYAGGTPLEDAPATALPMSLSTLTAVQTGNDIRIAWTYPTQPEAHTYVVQIRRYGPGSVGKKPDSHWTTIIAHEGIATSPYDDPLTVDGRYGYWARVVDATTGETSPYLRAQDDFLYLYSDGPHDPGTVIDRAGIGTEIWLNPTYAKTQNDAPAHVMTYNVKPQSHYLYASNFGFSVDIPDAAVIRGIVVEIDRYRASTACRDNASPRLVDETAAIVGTAKPTGIDWANSDTDTYIVYGSSSDLWGVTGLSGADVKDIDFGVVLSMIWQAGGTSTAAVDHIRMTVYWTLS